MGMPKYDELYLDFLKFVRNKKEYKPREIKDDFADYINLSEENKIKTLRNGKSLFFSKVEWCNTYLYQAGLVDRVRWGYYKISDEGEKILESNPSSITNEDLANYPSFVEFINRSIGGKSSSSSKKSPKKIKGSNISSSMRNLTPEEEIENSFDIINNELANELLQKIWDNSPSFFEKLVLELLLKMGYGGFRGDSGFQTSLSGDGGIDGIINQDVLGLNQIAIQAKRYAKDNIVYRPDIQRFAGALDMANLKEGVFISTSTFSPNAKKYARDSNYHIALIDGEELANLMIEYDLGVSVETVYELKKIDSDFFEE